jgi:hypothetical protein
MQVDKFSMGVELDVFPPAGGDSYEVQYVFAAARLKTMLSVGMEVPVEVMDDDPSVVGRAVGRAEGFDRGVGW